MPVLRLIAAIVVPPLGVFLARGIGGSFWISCLLTILGWLPGAVYAVYTVVTTPEG